jgi:hypothetical protein
MGAEAATMAPPPGGGGGLAGLLGAL